MKTKQYITGILGLLVLTAFTACDKMDATYSEYIQNGEIIYAAKPNTVTAHPGNKRIKLTLNFKQNADPEITKIKVYWNFKADSAEFPVQILPGQTSVAVTINDLPKGAYSFDLFTFNKAGNSSVKMQVAGNVYDDEFASARQSDDLSLRQAVNLVETNGVIEWFPEAYFAGIEVKYTDVAGAAKVAKKTGAALTSIAFPDVKPGSAIEYRMLYLPDTLAIDTAFSNYIPGTVPLVSQLDKSKFVHYKNIAGNILAGDVTTVASSTSGPLEWTKLWDDKYGEFDGYQSITANLPHSFTIDLGVTKKLGSFRYFMRGINGVDESTYLYNNANPKTWELWGRGDEPNADGSYTGWKKLGTATPYTAPAKPSVITDADRELANAGFLFTIPAPYNDIPVRYLRWKTLTNYGNVAKTVVIQELAFYEKP
ncbi:MAG TPA: DUF4998 domain-containing protein [Sphingobacteriaceae bacterium]